jgi:hypothetical protein
MPNEVLLATASSCSHLTAIAFGKSNHDLALSILLSPVALSSLRLRVFVNEKPNGPSVAIGESVVTRAGSSSINHSGTLVKGW